MLLFLLWLVVVDVIAVLKMGRAAVLKVEKQERDRQRQKRYRKKKEEEKQRRRESCSKAAVPRQALEQKYVQQALQTALAGVGDAKTANERYARSVLQWALKRSHLFKLGDGTGFRCLNQHAIPELQNCIFRVLASLQWQDNARRDNRRRCAWNVTASVVVAKSKWLLSIT